jgi:hypothetical protein
MELLLLSRRAAWSFWLFSPVGRSIPEAPFNLYWKACVYHFPAGKSEIGSLGYPVVAINE